MGDHIIKQMGLDDHGSSRFYCHVLVLGYVAPEMGPDSLRFLFAFPNTLPATGIYFSLVDQRKKQDACNDHVDGYRI